MTYRLTLLAVLATKFTTPVAAQIPDSLAHLGLPDNPIEYAQQLSQKSIVNLMGLSSMYRAGGCAFGDGWTNAAFTEMFRIAESDPGMRKRLAMEFGTGLSRRSPLPCDDVDLTGFETWITGTARDMWESGELSPQRRGADNAWSEMLFALSETRGPEARTLASDIAFDPDVRPRVRYKAAHIMRGHRTGIDLDRTAEEQLQLDLDAVNSMLDDHFYELPEQWVLDTMSFLRAHERITVDEHLEMLKRLHHRPLHPQR